MGSQEGDAPDARGIDGGDGSRDVGPMVIRQPRLQRVLWTVLALFQSALVATRWPLTDGLSWAQAAMAVCWTALAVFAFRRTVVDEDAITDRQIMRDRRWRWEQVREVAVTSGSGLIHSHVRVDGVRATVPIHHSSYDIRGGDPRELAARMAARHGIPVRHLPDDTHRRRTTIAITIMLAVAAALIVGLVLVQPGG